MIVKPNTATNIANPILIPTHTDPTIVPTLQVNDDCDTVTKVEVKLLQMEQHWGRIVIGTGAVQEGRHVCCSQNQLWLIIMNHKDKPHLELDNWF